MQRETNSEICETFGRGHGGRSLQINIRDLVSSEEPASHKECTECVSTRLADTKRHEARQKRKYYDVAETNWKRSQRTECDVKIIKQIKGTTE